MSYVDEVLAQVKEQNPSQHEFNQAVKEVFESLRPMIEKNEAEYRRDAILERLCTPERIIIFRVPDRKSEIIPTIRLCRQFLDQQIMLDQQSFQQFFGTNTRIKFNHNKVGL